MTPGNRQQRIFAAAVLIPAGLYVLADERVFNASSYCQKGFFIFAFIGGLQLGK
jgi:hypothetical protein